MDVYLIARASDGRIVTKCGKALVFTSLEGAEIHHNDVNTNILFCVLHFTNIKDPVSFDSYTYYCDWKDTDSRNEGFTDLIIRDYKWANDGTAYNVVKITNPRDPRRP